MFAALTTTAGVAAVVAPSWAVVVLHYAGWALFAATILVRLGAVLLSQPIPPIAPIAWAALPSYTVVAPLFREAAIVDQLVGALSRLNYPRDRLQILLVLENDDETTRLAAEALPLEPHFTVFIAPPGAPRTKPRACNEALALTRGEHLVVYDAEDRPDPDQLLEAAARFARDPDLACLQAPLRIDHADTFLGAQFALEYAAQFEALLPALHRLGLCFPLGGSSNHFRTEALRALGGWDAYNVTEDADLGFRFAAAGLRTGLLVAPTWEAAPRTLAEWLPQRSRWIKGHVQTWLVHMRRPLAGGARRLVVLQATVGLGVLSSMAHAPVTAWAAASLALGLAGVGGAGLGWVDGALAVTAWAAAAANMRRGALRANRRMDWRDAFAAPFYWPLHSAAACRAVVQLITRPSYWDKTDHRPTPAAS